jgi:hypothetical protein
VIGTGTSNTQSGLYLAPDPVSLTNDLYLRVRGNIIDEPTHIHFDTGNNQYFNQFIGDDNKYIQLANTGNIVVNSNDGVGNSAQWTFNTAGTLTLPGGSRIRPLGANLDLFAGGGYVNLITADESSYMGVSGNGGFITTVSGTWQFDATGNLSAPGNVSAVGNVTAGNISAGSGTITGGNVNGANFNGNVAFGTGTVGGSGNITGGNILTAGIVSATGNVSGNFFIGNGSQLTGIAASYGNANVATFLAAYGSNTVSTTGNITGNYFIGNGSQLTGISGNIANITANVISFNTAAGINVAAGQMAWNSSDGTLDIGLSYANVVLQVGQETHYVVRNDSGNTILNGTAVYCSGVAGGSGRIEASPMTGSTDPVKFLGLATQDITDGVNGVVTYFGYVRGLDTRGTANTAISVGDETWAVGDQLYVHPTAAGKLTNVEPAAPNVKICVASILIRNQTSGVLFVRPTTNLDMVDLSDVQIDTPANGEVLQYVSANSRWENTSISSIANGNSNVSIASSNGNVTIAAVGNTTMTVTGTGANITGTLNATGNITGSYLISAHASGDEGGEISLAQPPNGNLSGGITIDAYQNTLRMFEQGGTARGLSIDIANSPAGGGTAIGYRDIPQVAAGNVTLAATDAGKHYYSTTAGNLTLTIPLNSTVPFTTGTAISIVVQAAGNILVNAASGVTLYMAGNSTAANRVVGGYGMATLMKVASDTWFINGAGVA